MRDPFKLPHLPDSALRNMKEQITHQGKKPKVGITQGGSGRKYAGCKQAATITPKP